MLSDRLRFHGKDDEVRQWADQLPVDPSGIVMTAGTNTLAATVTWTPVNLDGTVKELVGVSISGNKLYVDRPGWYQVNANIYVAIAAGDRYSSILMNGATFYEGSASPATAGALWRGQMAALVPFTSPSDYLQIQGYQNSGGNLNMNLNALSVYWVRPIPFDGA